MNFPTDRNSIEKRIDGIDPLRYAKTRNFIDGSVTRLSPYITHGYISLPALRDRVLEKYSPKDSYTFIFELAWREFFQRTYEKLGEGIFDSIRHVQAGMTHADGLPEAYLSGRTTIRAIDEALHELKETGYMHNHARMWAAMLVTNIGKTSWQEGAKHMYYHLLDGDRASNILSWQWVAGTFSSKQYVANQEMINRFATNTQKGTYLDAPVESLLGAKVPDVLASHITFEPIDDYSFLVEKSISLSDIAQKEVWLYSMWTLDPAWEPSASSDVQKILVIEPHDLLAHPMSKKRLEFILGLAENIEGLRLFCGDVRKIEETFSHTKMYKKHHPALFHWPGEKSAPEYLFPQVESVPGGFMSYWKKCERYL